MTTQNFSENNPESDETLLKEKKLRSVYPAKDLQTIIEFVGTVYNKLGHTTHLSNKAIAAVHELSPESIKGHLSSGQQYKVLDLKHGIGYKITDHFEKLFLPKNANEKRAAVIEALKNPESYQQLFRDYEYHVVPPDGVKNHFIRNFGFREEVANRAAQIFIENLKNFDLLDNRGVLISALPQKSTVSEPIEVVVTEQHNHQISENQLPALNNSEKLVFQSEIDKMGNKPVPIYLTNAKKALFVYPDDISEDDIELVKHQIEGVLLRIKLETKKKTQ